MKISNDLKLFLLLLLFFLIFIIELFNGDSNRHYVRLYSSAFTFLFIFLILVLKKIGRTKK